MSGWDKQEMLGVFCSWEALQQQQIQSAEYAELIKHFLDPKETKETKKIRKQKKEMVWHDNLLWAVGKQGRYRNNKELWRLWIPQQMRTPLMVLAHRGVMASHPGATRMQTLLGRRFWWKGMAKDIKDFATQCPECKRAKTPVRPGMGHLGEFPLAEEEFEFLHIDHVGPLPESEGYKYILTAVDRATNYCFGIPVKDATAKTAAETLWDEIICKVGVPRRIISDRGPAFKSMLCEELAERMGFRWQYTTAYNPRTNGKVERLQRPVKAALRTYCMRNQKDWPKYVPSFIFAMNNLPSESQGGGKMAPHWRVFGRIPKMPHELIIRPKGWSQGDDVFARKVQVMADARSIVTKFQEAEQVKKKAKEKTTIHVEYKEGDVVLLHVPVVTKGVSSKLQIEWQGPYFIVRQVGPYNYLIEGRGRTMIVHVRRLVKYDPYLMEHESIIEALERMEGSFGNTPPVRKTGEQKEGDFPEEKKKPPRQRELSETPDKEKKSPVGQSRRSGEATTGPTVPSARARKKRRVTFKLPQEMWRKLAEVRKVT